MNQELERFEPAATGGRIAYEHLHRYALCADQAAGLRVLDVACGAGYGSNILAEVAAEVVGIDIDAGAIRRASKKHKRKNLQFVAADCTDLPFEPESFDLIVANELIEHIADHDEFLVEVKRVLKPGGSLIISTPNKPIYNRYKSPNPFHVSEMNITEFRRLLRRYFGNVYFTGLRMALVSASFDLEARKFPTNLAAAKTYGGSGIDNDWPEVTNNELVLHDPEYILATCSDRPIDNDASHPTIFFSTDTDLWLEHEKVMSWASNLHDEDELLRTDLQAARTELDTARLELDKAEAALEEQKRQSERSSDDARQHLAVSARLLGRLTGGAVELNSTSLVEAMFTLNDILVTQRVRLEALEKVATQVRHLERELEHKRAAQELQVTELKKTHAHERDMLVHELEGLRESEHQQSESLRQANLRIEEIERDARRRDEEGDKSLRAAEQRSAELERELKSLQRMLEEKELRQTALALSERAEEGVGGPQSSGFIRRRARLMSSHREIQEELSRARHTRGHVGSEPIPVRRWFASRWKRARPRMQGLPFERKWVGRQDVDASDVKVDEFLRNPRFYRLDPHPLFSVAYYLQENPDLAQSGMSPFQHYLDLGWREGRNPHPYFANDWYLVQNPDVANAGLNPLCHYLEHGWREGRRPNPVFDPTEYLSRYPDVKNAGIDPLTHFIMYGLDQDRDVPFRGLEDNWRALVRDTISRSLMDHLLTAKVDDTGSISSQGASDGLPLASVDFWIPQALRDFMVERGWEGHIPLFTRLYSVMDAYAEAAADFARSVECDQIIERARLLSAAMAVGGERPDVSIVIPVFNNLLDTLLCIVSLLETQSGSSFEIVVADDCSTDMTEHLIPQIGGVVRHIRNDRNVGFVQNCNKAAESCRGKTLVFLNNDTLVFPGWLENLVAPFKIFEKVGLVGSKLINWDGRLQEAGGVFWKDGSAWNFGRGQNAFDPQFNYLKDVDYCSGASIAVPTSIWSEIGGFDTVYSPAYCEDSDLAFKIRAAGLRTLYSPHSELIHHEGRSHGRDPASGTKSYQLINQKHFFERWRDTLERDHFTNGDQVLRARDRSRLKRHILVIDHYVPQFDKDAGSRTMFQFLWSLVSAGWSVTFWPENLNYDREYTTAVENIGVEVVYGPRFVGGFSDFLRERSGLYDAVLLSRPHVAVHFVDDVRTLTSARVLYYGHDVHFERMRAQHEVAGTVDERAVEAMRALEIGLCNRCDVVLYPSKDEAKLMSSLVTRNVLARAIPAYSFGEDDLRLASEAVALIAPLAGRAAKLLFVGGFSHGPNVDGIVWFCREVAPLLRQAGFVFEVSIAGSNPTADVWDLENDSTQVLGFVSDERLDELYRDATMVIAPLRFGAGVKGKVIEAMAKGVPLITTQVGAQGIEGADEFLFIGDSAEEFAIAVRSAADDKIAASKAARAIDYVRDNYSRQAMMKVFKDILPVRSARKAA